MSDPITSGKIIVEHVNAGWELWHVSKDQLPGAWHLQRRHERKSVHWDAIEIIRRHYLTWFEENTEERQEGRYTWSYIAKQRSLNGGVLEVANR